MLDAFWLSRYLVASDLRDCPSDIANFRLCGTQLSTRHRDSLCQRPQETSLFDVGIRVVGGLTFRASCQQRRNEQALDKDQQ